MIQIKPDFKRQNEFVQAQYYHTGGTIGLGNIIQLITSAGMARRKIWIGSLPFKNDIGNMSAFPKPSLGASPDQNITTASYDPAFSSTHTPMIIGQTAGAVGNYINFRAPTNGENYTTYNPLAGLGIASSAMGIWTGNGGSNQFGLAYNQTNLSASAFQKPTKITATNFLNGFASLGQLDYKCILQFSLKGAIQLELPFCTKSNSFISGYSSDNSGFGASLYGNALDNEANTLRVTKQMTIDGVSDYHNLMISPFDTVIDCDEINLVSLATASLGVPIFFYLGILSEAAI